MGLGVRSYLLSRCTTRMMGLHGVLALVELVVNLAGLSDISKYNWSQLNSEKTRYLQWYLCYESRLIAISVPDASSSVVRYGFLSFGF